MGEQTIRVTMQQIRKLKSLSDEERFKSTTEGEINKQISEDPDFYQLTDEEFAKFELARREK